MPPKKYLSQTKCQICGLKTARKNGTKRDFMARYPLDEDRCKKWVKMSGHEDLAYIPIESLHQNKFVCGKHFEDKDYKRKKTQLKKTAVPSIRLTAKPLSDDKLIGFPCHIVRKQQTPNEVIPSTSSTPASSVFDYHATNANKNLLINILYESDIPPVEYTIDICTSEKQQDVACNYAIEKHAKNIFIENVVYERDGDPLKVVKKGQEAENKKNHSNSQQLTPKKRKLSKYKNLSHNLQLTPTNKKLVRKITKYKLRLKLIEKQIKMFNNINSKALKTLIMSASKNQNRCPQGKRWTENDKALAIAMFKKSPKLYRYLRQLVPLPSTRTLQSILSKMPMHPGFNDTILNHLRRRARDLTAKDRTCVIMFDEMSLKKRLIYNSANDIIEGYQDLGEHGRTGDLADKALVLLLQGVHKKFKQPLAHYFVTKTISSQKLSVIIKNAIKIVTELGFKIIATVCDQGPTNIGALNLLKKFTGHPSDSNFFEVDNNKVYIIYDIPHLFKSIRNNFFEGGEIVFNGKKAKWSHLVELHEKNKETLHFKKITALHVNPTFRAKMKVKLAAQILSNDVAAILKLFAETFRDEQEYDGSIKRDAILQTADVIEQLDKLFDVTNGPASKKDGKRGIRTNVFKNSIHHRLWPEFKYKIKTMHFLKSDSQLRLRNVRFLNGYYISISSLQDIWNYCHSIGFKYLNLRQLNQDTLENLFGLIRQHSPTNKNPTCQHFTAALKTTILTRLRTPIRGANCEADENQLMLDFHDLVFQNTEFEGMIDKEHSYTASIDSNRYEQSSYDDNDPVLHLPDIEDDIDESLFATFSKQPVVYVSGYLASVLIKRINCQKCCDSLRTITPGNDKIYDYISLKEWWKDRSSLTYPTLELCKTVETCVSVFERDVRQYLYNKDIGKYCHIMMLKEVNFSWLCKDHNQDLIKTLLSRLTALLLRNECRTINSSISTVEQLNSDKNKIAQLMSSAK